MYAESAGNKYGTWEDLSWKYTDDNPDLRGEVIPDLVKRVAESLHVLLSMLATSDSHCLRKAASRLNKELTSDLEHPSGVPL